MTKKRERVVIFGAGGHAKMIASSIMKNKKIELFCFVNEYKKSPNEKVFNKPIFRNIYELKNNKKYYYIVGIGDNNQRKEIYNFLIRKKFKLISIIDDTAIISNNVSIGKGCFIAPGSIINTYSKVKDNTIINSGSIIEHNCVIGKHCHIAPGVKIAGCVNVGDDSFIGIASTIKDKINIGEKVVVGAGSLVIDDIPDKITIVGVPAKKILKRHNNSS